MRKMFSSTAILLFAISFLNAQVKIIFDTDFGGDADDLGALAMLNHFHERGECDLLAVMNWSTEVSVVPGIDAVNRFYKHPEIPIGTRKDGSHIGENNYARPISKKFKNKLDYDSAPEVTDLYRKILAAQEDNSVVIVTVGPLKNIEYLLKSEPDNHSSLTGKELIEKKVKEFVIMGGQFPYGKKEWNFDGNMPGVTKYVIGNIMVPVTFSGFELGVSIKSGKVFNDIKKKTPLYVGFMYFSEHAPWMKENFKGLILDNSTFDQTAVLYAVRNGVGKYWEKIEGGYCLPDEQGGNIWLERDKYDHSYLRLIIDPEEMAAEMERFMLGDF